MLIFRTITKNWFAFNEKCTKRVLITFLLTAAAWVTDAVIQKKKFGSNKTTLRISNEEINDIMKIIKSLKNTGLLIKGVSETIENEAKEQKGRFLSMLLGTLGNSLLPNLLTRKGMGSNENRWRYK